MTFTFFWFLRGRSVTVRRVVGSFTSVAKDRMEWNKKGLV